MEKIKNGKECEWCGKEFTPIRITHKYCSKECKIKYFNNKRKNQKEKKKCKICKTQLKEKEKKYCSKECRIKGRKIYGKEYKKNNEEKIKINSKKYIKNNKETLKIYSKEYRKNNKEKIKISNKIYKINNKEKIKISNKEYVKNNKEKINKRIRKNRLKNIKKVREKANKYANKRYKEDLMFRLNNNISTMVRYSMKYNNLSKNGRHYEDLIINNLQEIIEHLEKNFLTGMTWDNYGKGGWSIDHIISLKFFKFSSTNDVEFKYCWSINNLQPLWELDNIKKGDKVMLWGKEINARDIDKYTNAII